MSATLVAIAGPRAGEIVSLDSAVSIGRGTSNTLTIRDMGLSRTHCVIDVDKGHFVVRDLDSRNATFVNGVPVKERALEHADQIRIGDSVLLVLSKDSGHAGLPEIDLHESRSDRDPTSALRPEDVLYLQSEQILASFPPPRLARDLRVLFTLTTSIGAIRDRDALVRELLDRILDAIPADCVPSC